MNEETRVLVELAKENARLKAFFEVLATKVKKCENSYRIEVDEVEPIVRAFNNQHKEIDVISFREEGDVSIKENG